jgi:predicted helicase
VQAKTNLFLQVSKLNAAASSALTYGLINQNELLAQANQQLFKATYENLLEVMHNAEVITDNLHILKKKILQLSGQKKFYYEVLHIAGFSLTLIFVFSLVLLLVRARI